MRLGVDVGWISLVRAYGRGYMCICVLSCMCVSVWERVSVCMCVCLYVCMCVHEILCAYVRMCMCDVGMRER